MLGVFRREREDKGASGADFALHANGAVVRLYDVLHDGKTQSRPSELAATRGIDAVETFKETVQMLVFDAETLVFDIDDGFMGLLFSQYHHFLIWFRVFNTVDNQVYQCLFQ